MASVDLEDAEWQTVLGMIAQAPWRDANPLLMKIGQQLRVAQQASNLPNIAARSAADGKEIKP